MIISIMQDSEAQEVLIRDFCKMHINPGQAFCFWRYLIGGMEVPDTKRLMKLHSENINLMRLQGEHMPLIDCLKDNRRKMNTPVWQPTNRTPLPDIAA